MILRSASSSGRIFATRPGGNSAAMSRMSGPAAAIALTGAKEKVESAIPALAQRLMQVATIIETRLGGTGGASTL